MLLIDVVPVAKLDLVPTGCIPAFIAQHPGVEQADHLHMQRRQHGDIGPAEVRRPTVERAEINDDQLRWSDGSNDARATRRSQPGGALGRGEHSSIIRSIAE